MADLLTVYDDGESNTFIDCTVCDKRIRGETNYKIHKTTLQHLKRERALADEGIIPKPAPLPQWTSIKQYLTYLKLNEPIIGLGDLVQESGTVSNHGKSLLQYRCRLCAVQMDICEMATHVVGRRHRQKYLERYRPELVTWEKTSDKQAGVVARAKAAIVEKQDGWGNPVPLMRGNKDRSVRNQAQDRPVYLQERASSGQDRRKQDFYNRSYMEDDSSGRPSRYHEDNQYNQSYEDDDSHQPSSSGNNRYDTSYSQDSRQRRSYQKRDSMERPYWDDDMNVRSIPSNETSDRRYTDDEDSQPYQDKWYPETNPSRRQYKSRDDDDDDDDDDYHGNISESRFGKSGMDYQQSSRMQDSMYTSHRGAGPGLDEREQQSRNLSYMDQGRQRFHDVDEREESLEMQNYNKRQSYYQPEDAIPAKKKRKSRFSDASPLEIALAQKSQINAVISKYKPQERAIATSNSASGYMESSAPRMENVLDVLNDVQIENVQEANFLKQKLCTLLKEFQANKAQRSRGQVLQTSTDFTDSYHCGNTMDQRRDMQESRRLDDQSYQESTRYDRDLQGPREYLHTRHVEEDPKIVRQNRGPEEPEYLWDSHRGSSAGGSEERMVRDIDERRGYRESAWNSRPLRDENRAYTEEHHYQHDYRSGGDLYNPFEPSPSPPPLEKSSSTLDKLASTLLELVAYKSN